MDIDHDGAHSALLYATDQEFLDTTVPFLSSCLAAGERILTLLTERNTALLREALGARSDLVDFRDAHDWFRVPAWTMTRNLRYLARHGATHPGVLAIGELGEVAWSPASADWRREWARYESISNLAPVPASTQLACAFDTRRVEPNLLRHVRHTHPWLLGPEGRHANPDYVDPAAFRVELDHEDLPAPPPTAARRQFTLRELATVRQLVRVHGHEFGLAPTRAYDAVAAVNEVAGNAIRHAGGSGELRIWAGADALVCEITDRGPPMEDPSLGWFPPEATQEGGRGLWVSRQLCELLTIRSGPAGNTVRLHIQR